MRHLLALWAFNAAFAVLAPYGASYVTDAATGANEVDPVAVETDVESYVGAGDVFQLDAPGMYSAFAIGSSGSLLTEVRGRRYELLATSHPVMMTTGAVDFASGLRFGIAAPQVFKVESNVTIHVQDDGSPYELVLVRVGSTPEFSRLIVRPPVKRVVTGSGPCLISDSRETFKIHTDAVYSDTGARQIFVIDSPTRSSTIERRSAGSADRSCGSLTAWPSLATTHSLLTSRFFAIR